MSLSQFLGAASVSSETSPNERNIQMRVPKLFRPLRLLQAGAVLLLWTHSALADPTVIRLVPPADLKVLDPVFNPAFITTEYAFLVYDQLFAVDADFRAQPQMVESYTVSDDRRTYRFVLRAGLRFHDGTPVRAADAVASIKRWAVKDPAGSTMAGLGMKLETVDDRTFTLSLDQPWGQVVDSMAKPSWALFVMPEQDANKPVTEAVTSANGSGPFRMVRSEWVPGSKVVFERNSDYVPRAEPASGFAGSKMVHIDRVEWHIIPDMSTAVAALNAGEVDVIENVSVDLVRLLRRNPSVVVDIFNKTGAQGILRPNHLYPPFNNPKAREALLYMVNQEDYMHAAIGDREYWRVCHAFLICGSPMGSEVGTERIRTQNLAKARELLQESGYRGERVVVLHAMGISVVPEMTDVAVQQLRQIGINVDEQIMEWGTMLTRRTNSGPPDQGGWNILLVWSPGLDLANPITSYAMTAPCTRTGWPGWACDKELESLRGQWAAAGDDATRKALAEKIQLQALNLVPIVPLGQFYLPTAYRNNLKGFLRTAVPVMWNVEKTN